MLGPPRDEAVDRLVAAGLSQRIKVYSLMECRLHWQLQKQPKSPACQMRPSAKNLAHHLIGLPLREPQNPFHATPS